MGKKGIQLEKDMRGALQEGRGQGSTVLCFSQGDRTQLFILLLLPLEVSCFVDLLHFTVKK